jgi:hypothetical protein
LGKIDMKAFSERCDFERENSGDLLELKGRRAAWELARSLEKNDIIRSRVTASSGSVRCWDGFILQ